VVALDFAGIQRQHAAGEPVRRRGDGPRRVFLREGFDEAMEAGAIFGAHMHKLHAHAVAGAAVANDGASAYFAAGDIEKELDVGARRKRLVVEEKRTADTHFLRVGDVALTGTLPGD
jgi:hypothetical protein